MTQTAGTPGQEEGISEEVLRERAPSAPGYKAHPEHKVEIAAEPVGVRVTQGERVLAQSDQGRVMHETGYPDRVYIPREDVAMYLLEPSPTRTSCPFKGDAEYFHLKGSDGEAIGNVAWSYPTPYREVFDIRSFIAFDDDKVTVETRAA